jgi:hypothetical protein
MLIDRRAESALKYGLIAGVIVAAIPIPERSAAEPYPAWGTSPGTTYATYTAACSRNVDRSISTNQPTIFLASN